MAISISTQLASILRMKLGVAAGIDRWPQVELPLRLVESERSRSDCDGDEQSSGNSKELLGLHLASHQHKNECIAAGDCE